MTRATDPPVSAPGEASQTPRKTPPRKQRAPKATPAKKAAAKVTPAATAAPAAGPAKKTTPAKKAAVKPAPAAEAVTPTEAATPTEPATPAKGASPAQPMTSAKAATPSRPTTPAEAEMQKVTPAAQSEGNATNLAPRPPEPSTPAAHPLPTPPRDTDRWAKLLADPAHAPELLALAAVQTIGPRARHWAATTTAAYPTATPTGLARLATRQFIRFGAAASVFGAVAGSYAALALVATRVLTEAELILHLAAAHGLDPTHRDRAVDLLVISGVHQTPAEAAEALAAIDGPEPTASGLGDAVWRVGRVFASRTHGWTVLRVVNRYFPGVSMLGAVLTSAADAQATAARALSYYRGQSQRSQESGSSS